MIKPEVLDAMVAAGCTAEQIAAAVKADQARSSGAVRQARYRARKASQSDGSDVTGVTVTDLSSPGGSSPTPPSPNPHQSLPPSPPKGGSSPTDRAFETFSEAAKTCRVPVPRSLTADRRRKIEARLREHGEDAWREACQKLASSPFCNGSNDRGWIADLDFICQPKSFNRLIEGGYDAPEPQARGSPRHETDLQRISRELRERQDDQRRTDFEFDGPVIQGFPG